MIFEGRQKPKGLTPRPRERLHSGCKSIPDAQRCRPYNSRQTPYVHRLLGELCNLRRVRGLGVHAIPYRCRISESSMASCSCGCFGTCPGVAGALLHIRSPSRFEPQRLSRSERLCSRALAENMISEAEATELLGRSVRDLHFAPVDGATSTGLAHSRTVALLHSVQHDLKRSIVGYTQRSSDQRPPAVKAPRVAMGGTECTLAVASY